MYQRQFNQYKTEQYVTTSQGKLIIMLYDGAIRFLQEAIKAIAENDPVNRGHYLGRAEKIIAELNQSLDMKKGAEVAKNLSRLYTYMLEQILICNARGEVKVVRDTIVPILMDLKDAWEHIVNKTAPQQASSAAAKGATAMPPLSATAGTAPPANHKRITINT